MNTAYPTDSERWQAIVDRDRTAEGQFWLGVRTTGVFCRPGCPARTPLRKNVVFFETITEALKSGLRPCKRCRPLGQSIAADQASLIGDSCKAIIAADELPSLETLSGQANMSPSHFQKMFLSVVGLTPAQFGRSVRERRLHTQLAISDSVIEAGANAGYSSNARLYADAPEALGMSPGTFRNRGKGETIRYTVVDTFLGKTLIAATAKGICCLRFGDDTETLIESVKADFDNAMLRAADEDFETLVANTIAQLGTPDAINLPLDVRGTAFQIKVWHALRQIPYGSTVSYGELAKHIGQPTASRAVASACGSNNVAVLIPCHRVIGKDGSLTGYRWGTERKEKLLRQEAHR